MSFENPFILYDNVLENSALSSSDSAAGFLLENLADGNDWTYWKTFYNNGSFDIDKGSDIEVDTLAILSHNLNNNDPGTVSVYVYESDSPSFSSYYTLLATIVNTDQPVYFDLTSGDRRYNRISFTGSASPVFAGVIFLGKKMEIPVGPEFSYDPDNQDINAEKYMNYDGRMISSVVRYPERKIRVPFKRIPQSFIISDLLPFLETHYSEMKPFFFVPDPGDVFGEDKIYYLIAPDNPNIQLPVYGSEIDYRNWTMDAMGIRQSTFR